MKREIKFKAKCLDGKGWIEGTPICINGKPYGIMIGEKESPDIDPNTVCQFTGMKDCEGNGIWEGDIVRDTEDLLCIDNLYEVVYIEEEGTFAFKSLDKVNNYEPFVNLFNACVVGNKFDKEE